MTHLKSILFCIFSLSAADLFAVDGWEIRQTEVNFDKTNNKKTEFLKVVTIAANRYRLDTTPVGEDADKAMKQMVIFDGESILACTMAKDSYKGSCFRGTPDTLLSISNSFAQGIVQTEVKQMQIKPLGKSQKILGKPCDMFSVLQDMESSMSVGVTVTTSVKIRDKLCAASEASGIVPPFKNYKFNSKSMKAMYKKDEHLKAAIKHGKLGVILESSQIINTKMGGDAAKMLGSKANSEMTKTLKTKSIKKLNVKDSFFQLTKDFSVTDFKAKK